jgi:hypothetical protein
VEYRLKKKLHKWIFLKRAARTIRILKVRNEVIREKGSNTNNFGNNGK